MNNSQYYRIQMCNILKTNSHGTMNAALKNQESLVHKKNHKILNMIQPTPKPHVIKLNSEKI